MNIDSLYKTESGEKEVKRLYDTPLTQWKMPHENIHVGTRQGNTFIIASGDKTAPVLILQHGADSNSLYWLKDIFD